jgi:hypothetical protein
MGLITKFMQPDSAKSAQPPRHALFCFGVSQNTALVDGALAARDTV